MKNEDIIIRLHDDTGARLYNAMVWGTIEGIAGVMNSDAYWEIVNSWSERWDQDASVIWDSMVEFLNE
jgi:hypothetical protein